MRKHKLIKNKKQVSQVPQGNSDKKRIDQSSSANNLY